MCSLKKVKKEILILRERNYLHRISGGDALGGHTRTHPEHDG
jgi:hypothetical protein